MVRDRFGKVQGCDRLALRLIGRFDCLCEQGQVGVLGFKEALESADDDDKAAEGEKLELSDDEASLAVEWTKEGIRSKFSNEWEGAGVAS